MALWLWLLVIVTVFIAVLIVNPTIRKNTFIAATYVSLTGWYYYRKWEKKHSGPPSSGRPTSRSSAPRSRYSDAENEGDVRYFEPADKFQNLSTQDQPSGHDSAERSVRDSSSSLGDEASSESDKHGKKKKKHGMFHSLRRSNDKRRTSESGSTSGVESSRLSDTGESTAPRVTRRTFSGRKKPPSWGE
ncbi:hypothetical protein ATCC90586_007945 [Pythium insidiosum]|nr:hypothetical protein ATCC90586_007945 [Pythium insidiosum]